MSRPSARSITVPVVAAATLLVLAGGVGGAAAGSLVTSAKIKDGTIVSVDVRDGSLGLRDLDKKARRAVEGPAAVRGHEIAYSAWVSVPADLDEPRLLSVSCPTGKVLLGGGVEFDGNDLYPLWSRPDGNNRFVTTVVNHSTQGWAASARVWATCAAGSGK